MTELLQGKKKSLEERWATGRAPWQRIRFTGSGEAVAIGARTVWRRCCSRRFCMPYPARTTAPSAPGRFAVDTRHGEADTLAEAMALEEQAIVKIEETLKALGQ